MYIKVEQINGKYRVTPDVTPEPAQENPKGMSINSYETCLVFCNIPERPSGIYCKSNQDNPSTDIWKQIENDVYITYDENEKTLSLGSNNDGYIFYSSVTHEPWNNIYFLKFNNQVYGLESLSNNRFYDLIPYTQNNNGPQITMNGNVLTPGIVTLPSGVDYPTVNITAIPGLANGYTDNENTSTMTDEGMEDYTIYSNWFITFAVDDVNKVISINKYVFERS